MVGDVPGPRPVEPALTPAVTPETEAAYRQGLMTSPLPMLLVGPGGRIIAVNPQLEDLLGYSEIDLHGRTVQELAHEDDRERVLQVVQRMSEHEPWRVDYEARWVAADGSVVWTRRHVFNVPGDDNRTDHIVALLEDITEERLAQRQASACVEVGRMIANGAELSDVADRLAAAAEERWSDAGCCVMTCDETRETLRALARGRLPEDLLHELGPVAVGPEGGACGNAVWHSERVAITDLTQDPRSAPYADVYAHHGFASAWQVPVVDPLGDVVGAFGLVHRTRREPTEADWSALEMLAGLAGIAAHVDHERRARAEASAARRRDATTGLPNALAFHEQLSDRDPAAPLAVLVVRLDNAATIAAGAGQDGPARVLREVAERALSLPDVRVVAHVEPMGLAIAVEAQWTAREAELLLHVLSRSVDLRSATVKPQLRAGAVVCGEGGRLSSDELLRRATLALPARGVAVHEEHEDARPSALLARSSEIERALQRDELVVHYQPQYSLATGAVLGCEALVRWQHPVDGLLMPAAFLPAVELADRGSDVLLRVIAAVRRDAAALRRAGISGRVSVNVSAADLRREQVLVSLHDPGDALWEVIDLELTETALVDDEGRAALEALAAVGYEIALDDFGTGWSSLSVLHTLPLAAVKIDRSFIQRLPENSAVAALVHGVAATCQHLGITVVAEGIETEEQAVAARSVGCVVGQGYLLHRPAPLGDIDATPVLPTAEQAPGGAEGAYAEMRALALQLFAEGASRHTIAGALNQAGHLTPSGTRWQHSTVTSLLRDSAPPALGSEGPGTAS